MKEGISRKSSAELHKEVLEHLAGEYEKTTDPAEQERIAKYTAEERSRAAKKALVSARQEQVALQALREKLGIARTETEHFDLSPEIAEAVATEQATKEKFERFAFSNTGEETVREESVYTGKEAKVKVQSSANEGVNLEEETKRIAAAEAERKAKEAEFRAIQERLNREKAA